MKSPWMIGLLCAGLLTNAAQAQSAAPSSAPAAAPMAAPASADAPKVAGDHAMAGIAAVYNTRLHGRKTASGKPYNKNALTAAHNTLPMGTRVKVTSERTKKSVVVRINDRGPTTPGRMLDLSSAAAANLGMKRPGLMKVQLEIVK
jgi:rare lipoprotein A